MSIQDWFNNYEGTDEETDNSGYKPSSTGSYTDNWLIPQTTNPVDLKSNPDEPYGLPPNWDYKQEGGRGPNGEVLPDGAEGWTPHGTPYFGGSNSFDEWRRGLSYRLHKDTVNILGKEMDIKPVFRAVGETLMGFGMAAGRGGELAEQALSVVFDTPKQFEQAEGITSWLDAPIQGAQEKFLDWRDLPEDGFRENAWNMLFNGAAEIANGVARWRVLSGDIKSGAISQDELADAFTRQWHAGQIAYTGWSEAAVMQEYMQRYDSGENPYLLAEELQDIGMEIAGELILDPINLLSFITKGNKAAAALDKAEDFATKPLPGIAKAIQALDAGDQAVDALKYSDTMIPAIMEAFSGTGADLAKLSDDVKFWGLVQSGKQNYIQNVAGNLFRWIANSTQEVGGINPDNTLEIMRGLVQMSSENADEVADGYTLITSAAIHHKLPANAFLSQAAAETSQALRTIMTDADGVFDAAKYAETLRGADSVDELIDIITPMMEKASKKLFPTLAERVNNGEELGFLGNTMLKAEKFAANPIYSGMNSAFARLYMGMNPGYVVRNGITNNLHILVDQGLGAYVGRAEAGKLPKYWGIKSNQNYITDMFGGLPEWVKGGIGAVGQKVDTSKSLVSKITGLGLEAGGKLEDFSGQRIVAHSVRESLSKMIQPGRGIPDVDDLIVAGLGEADAQLLQRMLGNKPGRAAEVLETFTNGIADEAIDTFTAMNYVSTDTMQTMQKYEMWDDYIDFTEKFGAEGTKEGWQKAVNEFFKKYDFTDEMATEIMPYPLKAADGTVASHHIDSVMQYSESGHASLYSQTAYSHQMGANKIADEAIVEFSQQTVKLAEQQGIDITRLLEESPEFRMIKGRTFLEKAQIANREFSNGIAKWSTDVRAGRASVKDAWRGLGLQGSPPDVTTDQFLDFLWDGLYRPERRSWWAGIREFQASATGNFVTELRKLGFQDDPRMLANTRSALEQAREFDEAIWTGAENMHIGNRIKDYDDIIRLGVVNDAFTAAESGAKIDHLLNAINKHLPEGIEKYENLYEVPFAIAEEAIQARAAANGTNFQTVLRQVFGAGQEAIGGADEAAEAAETVFGAGKLLPSPLDPTADISPARAYFGQYGEVKKSLNNMQDELISGGMESWGQKHKIIGNEDISGALTKYGAEMLTRENEAKLLALTIAKEKRDFTLLNYASRRNVDTIAGMAYPYQFFHGRTYVNWAKRMLRNPDVIKNYMKYRKALEVSHAGAPDWWKYNISSNELLGLDSENPIYMNIEATLNPLNGMLGVDFDDPARRVDWKSNVLMDMNSFGPSTHTIFSIANAIALHFQGEEDAASRFAGTLIPQTKVLGAIQSLIEQGFTIPGTDIQVPGTGKIGTRNISTLDPMTAIFSGGVDPYTQRRVDRSMHAMVDEGVITTEQAITALTQRNGEHYEMALDRAINNRAAGQISSFFLGVGFKGRSVSDIQTDKFYEEYNRLWQSRDLMNDTQFRTAMNSLNDRYEFGEMLLIGRKGGVQRDTALAYHVLGRIPPGQNDMLEAVGITREMLNEFYAAKGVEGFGDDDQKLTGVATFQTSQDYSRFMDGILDLSATLSIPGDATEREWRLARAQYASMNETLKSRYGDDILDLMGLFYSVPEDQDSRDAFIQAHPLVQNALDEKSATLARNPGSPLTIYYGGYDKIESYWRSSMYSQLEKDFGSDIFDIMGDFYRADRDKQKAMKRSNPAIQGFFDAKTKYQQIVNQNVARLGSQLDRPLGAAIRGDVTDQPLSFGQQALIADLGARQQDYAFYSTNEWVQAIGEAAIIATIKSLRGEKLSNAEKKAIENASYDLNLSDDQIIQLVGMSLQREGATLQN